MVFRYKRCAQLGDLCLLLIIISASLASFFSAESSPIGILLGVLGGVFILLMLSFVIHDFKLLSVVEVTEESISLKRLLTSSQVIPFSEVRRVLIRRDLNSIEGSHLTLIVFGNYQKIKTTISDLKDVRQFVRLLEERCIQYDRKMVRENMKGEFVDDLLIY